MPDATSRKVLVVEDQENLRILLRDNLELDGMVVSCAANGQEALALAADARPDVAIVDIGLPDMTGWEVCRRLRADPRTPNIELVILTAQSTGKVQNEMKDLHLKYYMRKPYDPIAMSELIKKL